MRTLARPWLVALSGAMLAWTILLCAEARSQYTDFGYQRFDLGNMVQAVWSTTQGRPLEVTLATGEQSLRLASHVDPILVLLVPVWMLAPSPVALASVQIAVCALGAVGVYWLGWRRLGSESAAGLMALSYLAYPWLAWTALDAVHPVTLAIPLTIFAIAFLDADRLFPFAIFAGLVAATGELMALGLSVLGLWYWRAHGRRRAGLTIAIAGVAWTIICVRVIVPTFSGAESPFHGYYENIGGSPEGVVSTVFTDPRAIIETLATQADILYLLALAAPLGGLFLLAPGVALASAPQFLANGLGSIDALVDPRSHHIGAIVPFLMAGTVIGMGRLAPPRRLPAAAAILIACGSLSAALGPWPLPGERFGWLHPWSQGTPSEAHLQAVRNAVALVPDGVPVATTNKVGSHVSAREVVLSVPFIRSAEWIVIDRKDAWVPLRPDGATRRRWGRYDAALVESLSRRLKRSPAWLKRFEREEVLVFERRHG